jgi:hypothetical protein
LVAAACRRCLIIKVGRGCILCCVAVLCSSWTRGHGPCVVRVDLHPAHVLRTGAPLAAVTNTMKILFYQQLGNEAARRLADTTRGDRTERKKHRLPSHWLRNISLPSFARLRGHANGSISRSAAADPISRSNSESSRGRRPTKGR